MLEMKRNSLRNRKRAAIAAIGTLMILAVAGITAVQNLNLLSDAQSLASVEPTNPRHPRWNMVSRDPAAAAHKIRKTEGVILSEVEAVGEVPKGTGILKLKAAAQTRAALAEMHYSWSLSENIRLKAGEAQGLLVDVKAGDRRVFEIELETLAPGPHRVIFRAWRMKNGEPVGNSAHFVIGGETMEVQGAKRVPVNIPRSPRSPEEMRESALQ